MSSNVQIEFLTGQKFIKQKEFRKALNIFLDLHKNNSQDTRILFNLGIIYFEINDFDKSIFYYEKFLKKEATSVSALVNLAIVKQSIGEINSAKEIYLKLIKLDKYKIKPYYGIFTLNPNYLSDEHYQNIDEIKEKQIPTLYDLGLINFLLSKKEKKNKNYQSEIEYLKIFHSSVFNSKYEYNMSFRFYYKQIINKHYDQIEINQNDKKNNDELKPIFIVGLPRSGSTLIESILRSSKENLKSSGECNVINGSVLEQIGPKIYIKNFDIDNFKFEIDQKKLVESTLKRYQQLNFIDGNKNQIFIDKSLENIFNIEIILNIFPKAKFLHTFRNPIDSFFSIYQSMLPQLAWTHSFEDILDYMDNYYKVIAYFKKKYPDAIMDIKLENFTESAEKSTKEIYKFCNLTWSKDSLNFYKRTDLISKTLSSAQIRNEVLKYDNKKYEPYIYSLDNFRKNYKWINY